MFRLPTLFPPLFPPRPPPCLNRYRSTYLVDFHCKNYYVELLGPRPLPHFPLPFLLIRKLLGSLTCFTSPYKPTLPHLLHSSVNLENIIIVPDHRRNLNGEMGMVRGE